MSADSLCSALAIADSSTFLMIRAPFFGENARMLSARSTGSPRIASATSRPFCADRRTPRNVAVVCIMSSLPLRRGGGCDFLFGRVPPERAPHRKFAKLVADHVLRHVHGDVLLAVVYRDCQSDELRRDRRASRPRLDRLL